MTDTTARLDLPMLRAGQAQKELSHNEALTLIDLLLQANVVALGRDTPPAAPDPGAAWVVGNTPAGAWAGRAKHLAGWTAGGWRFVAPVEGMAVWVSEASVIARYSSGGWTSGTVTAQRIEIAGLPVLGARKPAVANPVGGTVVDVEARAAIAALLGGLRGHGLIAS